METIACIIYIIKNTVNDKVYVGQTWDDLKSRWKNGYGYKRQPHMNAAINCYGKAAFYYELLTIAHTQEIADYWEKHFIEMYKSNDREFGYNLTNGGSNGKHSQSSKDKMSLARKGKPGRFQSPEIRAKISTTSTGRVVSEETKTKISIANSGKNSPNFGKNLPVETRKKISEATSGENHPFFGREHSALSKEKMQMNCQSRVLSKEDVLRIRELHEEGDLTQREIAELYQVSFSNINDIVKKRSWKNI